MSEHTPGPLEIVEAKTVDNSGNWHVYLAAPDGRKIAALWGGQDEKIGNAHLFRAAPNLLRALSDLIDCCEKHSAFTKASNTMTIGRMNAARAAIAKAEGRS